MTRARNQILAYMILLLFIFCCPLRASGNRTIWLVEMPHEPAIKLTGDPEQQQAMLRQDIQRFLDQGVLPIQEGGAQTRLPKDLIKDLINNSKSELEQDPEFAKAVLGQNETFQTVVQFARQAKAKGYTVKLRFLPWSRALREIEQRKREYVDVNGDVMITQVPSSWSAYLASRNILRNLSSLVGENQFRDTTLCWYTWNGNLYAIPYIVDMRFLFYNKDKYSDADFRSEASFLEALAREKGKDNRPGYFPFGIPTAVGFDSFHLLANLFVNGGEDTLVQKRNVGFFPWEEATLDSPPAQHVVDLLATMRWNGYIEAAPIDDGEAAKRFIKGDYDMVLLGAWVTSYYDNPPDNGAKPGFHLGIALPPDLGHGRHVFEGGSGFGLCARDGEERGLVNFCKQFIRDQSRRETENELPAAISVQQTSALFRRVTIEAGWKPQDCFTYPILAAWASAVEQQPISDFFWKEVNNITPATSGNAAEQQRLHADQRSLRYRLLAINDDINDQLTPGAIRRLGMPWSGIVVIVLIGGLLSWRYNTRIRVQKEKTLRITAEAATKQAHLETERQKEETLRIEAEAATKQAHLETERQKEETLRKEAQAVAATAQLKAYQETAAMLAHRLRGWFAIISCQLDWILQEPGLTPQIREMIVVAQNALTRATAIFDQFSDYGKRQIYELDRIISPDRLIADLAQIVRQGLDGRRVQVHLTPNSIPGNVNVNISKLEDDFLNFAKNAHRYSDCRNMWLSAESVSTEEATGVGLSPARKYLKLIVRDDGPGVPESLKKKIFTPYFTTSAGGSGLGLAICWLDMQKHQGTVVECGTEGEGARFELFLPVTEKGEKTDDE